MLRQETGTAIIVIFSGACVGVVLGGMASGVMCASTFLGGWPSVYYIFGTIGIVISLCSLFFVYNSPNDHPRITEAEKKFITENQEIQISQKKLPTPWGRILTSLPFWAMCFATFGNYWMYSHFVTVHPTYLGTILHFIIAENGILSSMPYALQFAVALLSSWLSDRLIRTIGISKSRKGFNLLSCLCYSACVLGISLVGHDKTLVTVFSVLAIGTIGFSFAGCLTNPIDLSPTYTGSVTSLCSLGALSAIYIVPVVVGNLTKHEQTMGQWNKMFYISIAIVMLSGIIFCVFGSGEVQPWNYPPKINSDENETHNEEDEKQM